MVKIESSIHVAIEHLAGRVLHSQPTCYGLGYARGVSFRSSRRLGELYTILAATAELG